MRIHGTASNYNNNKCRCDECKAAKRATDKAYREENRGKIAENKKWYNIERNYGVTREQWDAQWDQQDGNCGLCSEPLRERTCVDHCHETGAFRGLLHVGCNVALGRLGDTYEEAERRLRSYLL